MSFFTFYQKLSILMAMFRFIFLACICALSVLFSLEDELSVMDESLPRLPEPVQEEKQSVLIKSLKGMVLIQGGDEANNVSKVEGIQIDNLKVPGNSQKLKRELSDFLGKEVTPETIFEIKTTIFDYYVANHHPLVIIEIPSQDVTSGVLVVQVLESHLGKVDVEGARWSSEKRLKEYVKLRPNQEIDENRLLKSVSFMNRNPFRRVDGVYAPGEEDATTDVILSVKDRRSWRVYAGAENTGVEPTGRGRWYTGVNWGNAFGLDHILSYQFTSALNVHRFHAHTAEYLALLSWGHVFNVYGGYSKVHPKVHYPFKRNDGWSMQTSARYTIPLKIYRYLEHEISFGGDFKRTNNTFEFSEDFPTFGNNVNLTQLVLGYIVEIVRKTPIDWTLMSPPLVIYSLLIIVALMPRETIPQLLILRPMCGS